MHPHSEAHPSPLAPPYTAHQANKKLDLWSLPEVLVVHLKRFSYSRASRDKLDTKVEFPLTDLDLGRHILGPASDGSTPESNKYDLYAVSNHYGGLGGGHYTAYCKMPDDNLWYLFDDGSVRCVPATEVQSPAAYVLFYRRQGSKVGYGDGWVMGCTWVPVALCVPAGCRPRPQCGLHSSPCPHTLHTAGRPAGDPGGWGGDTHRQ